MNGYNGWSYAPYEPFLFPRGEIYLCRVAPARTSIRMKWLGNGDDMIFLCRTAHNGAATFHDSNYSTFHRIPDFRTQYN